MRRTTRWVGCFLVLSGFFFIGTGILHAGKDPKGSSSDISQIKEVEVKGFRSAHFGMTESEVRQAIQADFGVSSSDISVQENPTQRTKILSINVNNILPDSGQARVFYVFGYNSKKLIQTNVVWGHLVSKDVNVQGLVNTANQLRNYFLTRGYKKEGMVANYSLNKSVILVFRALDSKNHATELYLINANPEEAEKPEEAKPENVTLRLSYIENPTSPDIYLIKEGDF